MKSTIPCDASHWEKVKPLIEVIKNKPKYKDLRERAGLDVSVEVKGDSLDFKAMIVMPSRELSRSGTPQIPSDILELLKDVDQSVELDIELGTSLEEIMSDGKPVLDYLLGGFKVTAQLTYIKKLKKILSSAGQQEAL
jgi:hypothetical protein